MINVKILISLIVIVIVIGEAVKMGFKAKTSQRGSSNYHPNNNYLIIYIVTLSIHLGLEFGPTSSCWCNCQCCLKVNLKEDFGA